MKKLFYLLFFTQCVSFSVMSQKVNTDSLLFKGLESLKSKNYTKAIAEGRLGVTIAPDYTDFYMLLGRAFLKTGKTESARYYFNHVMATAPAYKDAFVNSSNMDNAAQKYDASLTTIEDALLYHKGDKDLRLLKLKTLKLKGEEAPLIAYLKELLIYYPEDTQVATELRREESKFISDRIGVDHSYSTFSRDGVGPWLLTGLQYVRERKKTTFIGRVNYADRQANGQSIRFGYQVELDSYIKTGINGTSIANIAYSDALVFPQLRAGYSYLHNFDTGWELDAGLRYIMPNNQKNIYATALGVGKYLGSSWVNLSSFLFFDEGENYIAISGTYRYYLNTKYDFFALLLGYGSSPDESLNINPFTDQVSLDSYRAGVAYSTIVGKKLIMALQVVANRQEYVEDKLQNQIDFFMSLQYKL